MAENQDGQERTEEASAKKLADARKKGQVPRSRELSTMLVTIAGASAILIGGGQLANSMTGLFEYSLSTEFLLQTDTSKLPSQLYTLLLQGLLAIWPVVLATVLAAIVSSVVLGGWTFNLSLKLERLDPIKGLTKLFSLRSLGELVKSIIKMVVIGTAAVLIVELMSDDILTLGLQAPEAAIVNSSGLLTWFFLVVSLPLILIAAIDVPWQMWNYKKELRMTRQEVRDEHKESDGRPEVKAKLREMQQAAANRRMMEKVPTADVVITNPTHFSVALKYDEARMRAPTLVAKGADIVAARIREIAGENGVSIVESPRLARAIYANTQLDQEIPAGLYLAVAQILTYVYQLRTWRDLGGAYPQAPEPEVDDSYLKSFE
ncbi:flagellar biosynthesis protein FlhB [Spongiibacter nanhainus]|uniref:Flagellar biosynthetic protein FlhB n=1 Tax=Spongiibacter nanhainus TaxID=2794344 RepID=A0A7T4URE6_9GAMM|nr:flagellar biosynthesis protein FlhB [Spongiibacter nanhainus]QQD19743.1 flagellar biosynthesis protein FlhB [Spongiibacter nanhainus]